MSSNDVQSMLPEQIRLVEACLAKKNGMVELSLCVEVQRSKQNSTLEFSPRGTWLVDAVSLVDSNAKIGRWLESASTKINVSSGLADSEWVLEGKYYFEDKSPAPKAKSKPKPKPAAKPKPKVTPKPKPTKQTKAPSKSSAARKPAASAVKSEKSE